MDKITCALTGVEIDLTHRPEEIVRQGVIKRLLNCGYPTSRLAMEHSIKMGSSTKKCDIAILDREDKPFALIECKRSGQNRGGGALPVR